VRGATIGRRRIRDVIEKVPPPRLSADASPMDAARVVAEVADKVNESLPSDVYRADHSLITGTTRIAHGLGRPPTMVLVTPKTASAGFAVGWDPAQPGNPRPDTLVTITVVGGPMQARIEVR
jgi:hypothetical protein